MGVESGREGGDSSAPGYEGDGSATERSRDLGGGTDESSDRDGNDHNPDGSDVTNPAERSQRVHVRRLTVVDTLRWSWAVLGQRPALVGLGLMATLPSVPTTAGITPTPTDEPPEIAGWVWSLYLVQLLATGVVSGVVYLTAADAVTNRSRPLSAHVRSAVGRLPWLLATGVVMGILVVLSLLPSMVGFALGWPYSLVGLPVVLLGIYVFYRLLLALPACVVDDQGPFASSRDGWAAATGIVRKVFAVGVVYVLAVAASNVVASGFGSQYDVAPTLVSATIGAVVLPFFGLALAHLYLEGSRNR
jgi:hypothetical protein